MDWGVNDSLKSRSYGVKKDYAEKLDKISQNGTTHKQYYPISSDGNIDEWQALAKQQQELVKKHNQDEKQQQTVQKKQLYNHLDRQRYEKIQGKLAEDQMKQREMLEMKEKEEQLKKAAELEAEQKAKYLDYMNQNYKSTLKYKEDKSKGNREAEIEEERERLKLIQKDLRQEELRKGQKKANFTQEAQEVVSYKRMIKEMENKRKVDEKDEYQKLAQENHDREVERENNYKRYFQEFDNDMSERMANHMKFVTSAHISKQNMLDEIEDKNVKQYQNSLKKKEERELNDRQKQLIDMKNQNKTVLDRHDREKMKKREEYQKLVEQRQKEEQEYLDSEKRRLEDEEEKRKLYKEALEYQKNMHEYNKQH